MILAIIMIVLILVTGPLKNSFGNIGNLIGPSTSSTLIINQDIPSSSFPSAGGISDIHLNEFTFSIENHVTYNGAATYFIDLIDSSSSDTRIARISVIYKNSQQVDFQWSDLIIGPPSPSQQTSNVVHTTNTESSATLDYDGNIMTFTVEGYTGFSKTVGDIHVDRINWLGSGGMLNTGGYVSIRLSVPSV